MGTHGNGGHASPREAAWEATGGHGRQLVASGGNSMPREAAGGHGAGEATGDATGAATGEATGGDDGMSGGVHKCQLPRTGFSATRESSSLATPPGPPKVRLFGETYKQTCSVFPALVPAHLMPPTA